MAVDQEMRAGSRRPYKMGGGGDESQAECVGLRCTMTTGVMLEARREELCTGRVCVWERQERNWWAGEIWMRMGGPDEEDRL